MTCVESMFAIWHEDAELSFRRGLLPQHVRTCAVQRHPGKARFSEAWLRPRRWPPRSTALMAPAYSSCTYGLTFDVCMKYVSSHSFGHWGIRAVSTAMRVGLRIQTLFTSLESRAFCATCFATLCAVGRRPAQCCWQIVTAIPVGRALNVRGLIEQLTRQQV